MRDLLLASILLVLIFQALRHPWIGVLGWTWISTMNPHAMSWRMSDMPVAAAMAGATLLGVLLTKDKRSFFVTRESAVLMLFMLWMCITLPFSIYLADSMELWSRVMKIDFMILVSLVVLYSRQHIMAMVWVMAGSLAFFGVKGGIFTIATGGSYRVWGPENTYIGGNNEVALALVIVIPLIEFLRLQVKNIWANRALGASMLLCAVAALGSQSRGALLAVLAMFLMLWVRGKHKVAMGVVLLLLGVAVILFMPDSWSDRMSTIKTYDQDSSALGRINAWWMAFNLAKANFFGGGFMIYTAEVFAKYAPDPTDIHAAHSIYFMVLGEQGFIGLFLFLLIWILVWNRAGKLFREGRKLPQTQWVSDLGGMCQVSLLGYAVGGAFLSLSYYDLPYNILVVVVVAWRWLERKGWKEEKQQAADAVPDVPKALA
ncbi:MAG: putative O-glycosylation ligase, exosortase A system-associated [Paucibacter sp.]|nr:putative O-glycosylation ligase, exosortase A system-associated [Roseateles sp.]